MKHHFITLIFSALFFLLTSFLPGQSAQELARVSITVSNLAKAIRFYEEVLTFKKVDEYTIPVPVAKSLFGLNQVVKVATLKLGEESIELLECAKPGRVIPLDSKSNDLWFQHIAIVVQDMQAAYLRLRQAKVQFVSSAPQTLPAYLGGAAGISAFYFQDPDGHNLEIIHFPVGKGQEKWQSPQNQLFLGIDHTAIGVAETERSLNFYQTLLGLKVAGNSENYGPEQEHLNQVFGAHLQITGLKAKTGYGLEFLDYLAPAGGRKYPTGSKVNDLWHWHTQIFVPETTLTTALKDKGTNPLGMATFKHPVFGPIKAALFEDPDGHEVLLMTH